MNSYIVNSTPNETTKLQKSDILKKKIHLNKIALYTSPIVCGLQGENKKRKPCIIFRVSKGAVYYKCYVSVSL